MHRGSLRTSEAQFRQAMRAIRLGHEFPIYPCEQCHSVRLCFWARASFGHSSSPRKYRVLHSATPSHLDDITSPLRLCERIYAQRLARGRSRDNGDLVELFSCRNITLYCHGCKTMGQWDTSLQCFANTPQILSNYSGRMRNPELKTEDSFSATNVEEQR